MISLLFAAASLAAAAPSTAPQPVVISTAVVAAQQRLLSRCSAQGVLDLGAVLASPTGFKDLEMLNPEEVRDLVGYSACRELQGAGDCASLSGLGGGQDQRACHESVAQSSFAFQIFRGGDAPGACARLFAPEGKRGPEIDRVCAAVIKAVRAGDAPSVCPQLRHEGLFGPNEGCEDSLTSWNGKVDACVRIKDEGARRDCRERGALVAGLRAPASCPASPACRALTSKDSRACDGLLVDLSRSLCPRMTRAISEAPALLAQQEKLQREAELRRGAEAKARLDAAIKEKAQSAAIVKAKADEEAQMQARSEAKKAARAAKTQFRKGQPMKQGGNLPEVMKKMEKGIPLTPAEMGEKVKKTDADGGAQDEGNGGN